MLRHGPKSRKSSMQLSFKNDYVLETDTTAELKVGDTVLVYDTNKELWCREAVVCEVRPSGRSYIVQECKTGRKLLRSRRHLRREKGLTKRVNLHSNPYCEKGDVSAGKECRAVAVTQPGMHLNAGHRSLKEVREGSDSSPSPTTRGSTPSPSPLPSPPATASTTASTPRKVRFLIGTKRK